MDFLSKLSGSADKPHDQNPDNHKPSASELLSSARLVADAAKSSFGGGGGGEVDKGKAAGAGADLLGAASDYGKLDETKGVGKYVNQAEEYLNKYEKSHSATPVPAAEPKPAEPPKKEESGEKEGGGSGFGDYMKVAEGLLKK